MASFDVEKARQAGYSDQEIQSYMASKNLAPKFSIGGFAENIGQSALNLGKNILSAPGNLLKLGKNLITGDTTLGETGSAFTQSLKDRYGGLDEIARTLYFDPVGVATDLSVGAGAVSGAAKLGKLGKVSNVASKVSKLTDPMSLFQRVGRVGKAPLNKLGKGVESFGDEYVLRGLGQPKLTKKIIQQIKSTGKSPAEFFKSKPELFSRSAESAESLARELGSQYGAGIREISANALKTKDLFEAYQKAITRLKEVGVKNADEVALKQASALEDRLSLLKQSFGKTKSIEPEQFHKIARAVDKRIPQGKFMQSQAEVMGQPVGAYMRERNILRGQLRQQSPSLRQIGKEESIVKNIGKLYEGAESRGSARQPINFTKLGSAGVGAIAQGVPGAITGYVGERLINSPMGARVISESARAVGKGLQSPSNMALPTRISRPINTAYGAAKNVRTFLPASSYNSENTARSTNPNIRQQQPVKQNQEKNKAYKPTISPIAPKFKSTMPTAESFYAEIRKKRGY